MLFLRELMKDFKNEIKGMLILINLDKHNNLWPSFSPYHYDINYEGYGNTAYKKNFYASVSESDT